MPTWYTKQQADTLLAGKATPAQVASAIDALLAGAPGALNTLKELADAINDDANYAATVTAALNARPTAVQVAATYVPLALQADGITYNGDGTVATSTVGGITTTYTYDSNGNVATEARLGKTKTWSYDGSGNPTGSVIA